MVKTAFPDTLRKFITRIMLETVLATLPLRGVKAVGDHRSRRYGIGEAPGSTSERREGGRIFLSAGSAARRGGRGREFARKFERDAGISVLGVHDMDHERAVARGEKGCGLHAGFATDGTRASLVDGDDAHPWRERLGPLAK